MSSANLTLWKRNAALPTKIAKLTPEQAAMMPEWTDRWLAVGLSTEPADWERAEAAVRGCYAAAKLKQPRVVLRMGSPFAATLGGATAVLLLDRKKQVWSQVADQVRSQVRSQVGEALWQYRGAQLWAGWYAYISFFRDVCGWTSPSLAAYAHDEQLALSCGWTWWHEDVCAISDRPRTLLRDAQHRLHCETGPALAYPDGWSIYAWHGTRVPEAAIMTRPDAITLDNILAEKNSAVAHVWMRRAGAHIWDDTRVTRLHADTDGAGQGRELLQVAMGPASQPVTVVRVRCPSTGHEYRLHVPPTVRRCDEAVAWTMRLTAPEYHPAVES